jgi:hypothetical protein
MLRFWVRANRVIIDEVRPAAPDRVHVVVFDDLCSAPGSEIARLVEFLGMDVGQGALRELRTIPMPPGPLGRRQLHHLSVLDVADVGEVERLGFAV